jgi:hypothetical protein
VRHAIVHAGELSDTVHNMAKDRVAHDLFPESGFLSFELDGQRMSLGNGGKIVSILITSDSIKKLKSAIEVVESASSKPDAQAAPPAEN